MNVKNLLPLILICCTFSIYAQEQEFKLNREVDFGLNAFIEIQYHDIISRQEWNTLTPGYLNGDQVDSGYQSDYFFWQSTNNGIGFSINANLNKLDETKGNFSKFIRFSYNGGEGFTSEKNWNKFEKERIDTLSSSNSSSIFYIDSTTSKSYTKEYYNRQNQLCFAFLLQSNREKRFSFYGGLGFGMGFSSVTSSSVSEIISTGKIITDSSGGFVTQQTAFDSDVEVRIDDRFLLKKSKSFQLYAPIGVDMKFSKKNVVLEKFIFGAEIGFGYNWFFIPELETFSNHSFKFQASLKYRF